MPKLIAINGSPNENGNTAFLLNEVLKAAANAGAETEMVRAADLLYELDDPFCTACSTPCAGICYQDSQLERFFERLKECDALVLGSPVYFGTVSAQLKTIFDKSRKVRFEKALAGKVGAGVSVGSSRFGGQETTIRAMHDIMMVHGISIVADSSVSATIGHYGVSAQKPAQEDIEAIKSAQVLGLRLVEECVR